MLRAMVSQHGRLGATPPPPFLSVSPLESMRSGGAIPPSHNLGYLSDTCAIPTKIRQNAYNTPLSNAILKGYCAMWGAILHWATKFKKALRGFSVEATQYIQAPFLGNSVQILGVCSAVTLTFGPPLRLSACNSDFRARIRIISLKLRP